MIDLIANLLNFISFHFFIFVCFSLKKKNMDESERLNPLFKIKKVLNYTLIVAMSV